MIDTEYIKSQLTVDNDITKPWFVYKYTFPNSKIYIGKSNIYTKRYGNISSYRTQIVYKAMKKYGKCKKG